MNKENSNGADSQEGSFKAIDGDTGSKFLITQMIYGCNKKRL